MKQNKKGFTLIELMVVMAIIAVLAVLIIGAIQIARKTSVETANRGTAKTIQTGLEAYYAKNKSYPATSGDQTFSALVADNEGTDGPLFGLVTLQGVQCTGTPATGVTGQGGGYVTFNDSGYTINVSKWDCTDGLETW